MPITLIADDATTSSFSVHNEVAKPALIEPEPRPQRRRSVDFKPKEEEAVLEFERCDDDERHGVWYCREEYGIIKARNALIVKMMKKGEFQESNDHSFRGLEHKLKLGFAQRRENKFDGLNAVLEEQDSQFNAGRQEPELIARKYRRASLNALESAFTTGLSDARNSYCYNPDDDHTEPSAMTSESSVCHQTDNADNDTIVTIDTVNTNDSYKKTVLRTLFNAVSRKRKESNKYMRRSSVA